VSQTAANNGTIITTPFLNKTTPVVSLHPIIFLTLFFFVHIIFSVGFVPWLGAHKALQKRSLTPI
jgi:hypothetical protein